jgi:hypothetical protein
VKHDRRDFLKVFGVSSAAVVGAAGMPEVIRADTGAPLAPPPLPGHHEDVKKWEMRDYMSVVSGLLYDRIDIPKNGLKSQHTFFQSGWQQNHGPEYTNVMCQGRLDAPEMFKVCKVGVTFSPGISPELRDAIIRRYAVTLWLGQKYYFRAPMVEAFGPANSDPTVDFKTLFTLDLPLIIASDHNFWLDISTSDPLPISPKVSLWGVLHGQHARGVE